jgi:hypothetical protein
MTVVVGIIIRNQERWSMKIDALFNHHIGCDSCEYDHTPHYDEVDEHTGYVWRYQCIGTACATWPTGTPMNISCGCPKYTEKYQLDIFDFIGGDAR